MRVKLFWITKIRKDAMVLFKIGYKNQWDYYFFWLGFVLLRYKKKLTDTTEIIMRQAQGETYN